MYGANNANYTYGADPFGGGYTTQYTPQYGTSYQQSTTMRKQYSPDVLDALRPSAEAIIDVVNIDKMKPAYGNVNHDYGYKVKKARCVHRIAVHDPQYNGYVTLKRQVRQTKEGLRCSLCGAKICDKFDEDMKETIKKATEVIDSILTFGPDLGLVNYDPMDPSRGFIDKLIDTKEFFSTKLNVALEAFVAAVKNDTASEENERNLADMYLNNAEGAGYTSDQAFTSRI